MHRPRMSHGGGVCLGFDDRYMDQLQDAAMSQGKIVLDRIWHMHRQLVEDRGMPEGSWGVEAILQQLSSDEWEAALKALSIDGDKWKKAIEYLPGQRVFKNFDLTLIYTVTTKEGKVNIFLAEFFSGPDNPVGPGYTTTRTTRRRR